MYWNCPLESKLENLTLLEIIKKKKYNITSKQLCIIELIFS